MVQAYIFISGVKAVTNGNVGEVDFSSVGVNQLYEVISWADIETQCPCVAPALSVPTDWVACSSSSDFAVTDVLSLPD